jgi:hypothetical protein
LYPEARGAPGRQRSKSLSDIETGTLGFKTSNRDRVTMGDLQAITRVTNLLGGNGRAYDIRGANSASFVEMQRGPIVLFGAGNNPWTLRITDRLRFHFTPIPGGIVRESPQSALLAGRWTKVPVMIGANSADIGFPSGRTVDELFVPFGADA